MAPFEIEAEIKAENMQSKDVHKSSVVKALNFVYNLVGATESALGVAPHHRSS
jgi:hypothetical protein